MRANTRGLLARRATPPLFLLLVVAESHFGNPPTRNHLLYLVYLYLILTRRVQHNSPLPPTCVIYSYSHYHYAYMYVRSYRVPQRTVYSILPMPAKTSYARVRYLNTPVRTPSFGNLAHEHQHHHWTL
ncbi:uncharacterized protein EV422DRAFT_369430 [Fimicolochytrium jonesii]|uniref:uncharacterized protein n=1 Tax=Fimicolochytrium jonesii TaxID=1396493 RepID=UPI0022FEF564|nr:uncharacterized protein EV422DRAFT_369430 [Fimicolochytrium jonesii]KAI8823774.1 hypothetical protein EV422DRAFT_369430 [Fimicolochytrium jonesii]